jgi:hypothetical protein
VDFADEESENFVLIAQKLLNVDVAALEDNILKRQGLGDEFVGILFGEICNVDHGEMGGFLCKLKELRNRGDLEFYHRTCGQ